MSPKQKKLAGKAPPPNKLDEKDFAVLRQEKAKGRGMGLQDESIKPGKVMKAALGIMAMKKAKDKGAKGAEFLSPIMLAKRMFNKKAGGVMKYKRGSGLDLPVISSVKPTVNKSKRAQNLSEMKIQFNKQKSRMGKNPNTKKFSSMAEMRAAKGFKPGESASEFNKRRMKLAGATKALSATRVGKIALGVGAAGIGAAQYLKSKMNNKNNKTLRDAREQKKPGIPSETTQKINKALSNIKTVTLKKDKKMSGGMMQRPMGYNTGGPSAGFKSKQDRKKAEKNIKEAKSKEGLRSFLSERTNPMRKDRYMEGRKARHTEFKKKIGRTALGIASSLNPVISIAKGIGKVMGKGSKKRDFQKGDYGDISVKKNMGGSIKKYSKGMSYKDMEPYGGKYAKIKKNMRDEASKNVKRLTTQSSAYDPETRYVVAEQRKGNARRRQVKKTTDQVYLKGVANKMKEDMGSNTRTSILIPSQARERRIIRPVKRRTSSFNMGGMMMQKPMGYKHGTSVTAKCKLGRNKPTKIT